MRFEYKADLNKSTLRINFTESEVEQIVNNIESTTVLSDEVRKFCFSRFSLKKLNSLVREGEWKSIGLIYQPDIIERLKKEKTVEFSMKELSWNVALNLLLQLSRLLGRAEPSFQYSVKKSISRPVLFGIEIEGYWSFYETPEVYDYHSSVVNDGWYYEKDGSLSSSYEDLEPVEIISETHTSLKRLSNKIKKLFKNINEFYFDSTCGLHVHISIKNDEGDKARLPWRFISEYAYEKAKKLPESIRENILYQWFREYSTKNKIYNEFGDRYKSVNLKPSGKTHVEFRSFNAYRVSNKKTLLKLIRFYIKLARECLLSEVTVTGEI